MKLSKRDEDIVKLLNESSLYMSEIGEKFGLSRQRVWSIAKRAERLGCKIDRPKVLVGRHRVDRCNICKKLTKIANDGAVSRDKILKILNLDDNALRWHLRHLRVTGIIPLEFGTVRNERIARAVELYRKTNSILRGTRS